MVIRPDDPDYPQLFAVIRKAMRTTAELNALVTDDPQLIREVFSKLVNYTVDDSFFLIPPFYSDFGENIQIGKNVFVNHACTFMDRGGITLEDDVLIGDLYDRTDLIPFDKLQAFFQQYLDVAAN